MLDQTLTALLNQSIDRVLADVLLQERGTPIERAALAQLEPAPTLPPGFLQTKWIREQLARYTYKKGWKFSVVEGYFGMGFFQTSFACEDTYNPGVMTEVCKRVPILAVPCGNEEAFARWLECEIQDVEIHESREWLKRDGKIYNDPHQFGG